MCTPHFVIDETEYNDVAMLAGIHRAVNTSTGDARAMFIRGIESELSLNVG
jgi:hypothetical protein